MRVKSPDSRLKLSFCCSQVFFGLNMSGSLAQDAIALLIDLANQGEIDPWDVQVIDVIDRYLSGLVPVHDASQMEREVALSRSGQAFLYASMLVLLKADNLVRTESLSDEEETAEAEVEELDPEEQNSLMPLRLEKQLRRRAVAPVPKKRRVTLQELIDQLQLMSQTLEEYIPKRSTNRPKPNKAQSKAAVQALSEFATQENLAEVAKALDQFLSDQWHELTDNDDWLEIDDLVEQWQISNFQGSANGSHKNSGSHKHYDRVGVFWALLLLSAQSKVELCQEEFYQDLKIRSISISMNLQAM